MAGKDDTHTDIGTFSTIGTPFFFRLSNAKMMLRLIFIIGCVWNSTPKYTPNYWDSKRHLETFTFTLYCNLHLIISRLQFYDILWKYKFESLSLRWKELQNKKNPCKLILYRDFLFLVHGKNKHIKAFFRLSSFLVGIIFYTREVLLTHSFHLKRISVGNRRKSIACVINKNERNLASTI